MKTRTPSARSKVDEQSVADNFFLKASIIVTVVLVIAAFGYGIKFSGPLSNDQAVWGQFGDFFAGILNPLISFFTLMVATKVWLLQRNALSIQKQELVETRDAIRRQTFDQFFMSLLTSQRAMSEQVTLVDADTADALHSGKRAIDSYVAYLDGHVQTLAQSFSSSTTTAGVSTSLLQDLAPIKSALQTHERCKRMPHDDAVVKFCYFFTRYYNTPLSYEGQQLLSPPAGLSFEQIFGHIFRSTYQILKIVDEQFADDHVSKKRYVNLLRAQMSESEFLFFALSSLTKDGQKSWARSIRLNFFEGRLQNLQWTQNLAESFIATDENVNEANTILENE